MISFKTAGESHGRSLIGIIEGLPSNLYIDKKYINFHLKRRQQGYGRGGRMQIEKDRVNILSGLAEGYSTGNPIAIEIENKGTDIEMAEVKKPRPGHADLAGLLKYNQEGGRNILERASARETAMRVAMGSIARLFLLEFNIEIYSHVTAIGKKTSQKHYYNYDVLGDIENTYRSEMNVIDSDIEKDFIEEIKRVEKEGDSIGGKVELIVRNLPVGLGSYTSWDKKLDGLLSQAIMSIPAIKAVEIGLGFEGIGKKGSEYHDQIYYDDKFKRKSNNAGGIEGGMTNGEDLVLKMAMKPIPTLRLPLETIDLDTKEKDFALVERADTSAVPAVSVVGESMVALTLTNVFLEKFGGDSMEEIKHNFNNYMEIIDKR